MCTVTIFGFAFFISISIAISIFTSITSVVVGTLGIYLVTPDIEASIIRANYTNIDSKFTTVKGVEVHYRDQGNMDSNRPIVLLLHGAFASLHTWEPWIEYLQSDFRIISVDLPGQGVTGPHPAYPSTPAGHADFVDDFLKDLQLTKRDFYFVGNSYGGAISFNFYSIFNNNDKTGINVKKMVLIDSMSYPLEKKIKVVRLGRIPIARQYLRYVTPRSRIQSSVEEVFYNKSLVTDKIIDRYYQLLLRQGNRNAMLEKIDHLDEEPEEQVAKKIKSLNIPVLILWGRNDTWIPLKYGERLQQEIPNSKLIIYDNVGHLPQEEIPELSALDTKEFLLQ